MINNLARIFVWLRYSSARKLTWQRNYNTQPRILGEAQQRLTNQIAQVGGGNHVVLHRFYLVLNAPGLACSNKFQSD